MSTSTPEYFAAHARDLADKPPKPGPELIARFRRERRERRARLVAVVYRVIPFVGRDDEAGAAPREPTPAV